MAFSQILAIRSELTPIVSRSKTKPFKGQKNKKLALNSWIQTYQILTNDDEVCIPSLSSILIAVAPCIKLSMLINTQWSNISSALYCQLAQRSWYAKKKLGFKTINDKAEIYFPCSVWSILILIFFLCSVRKVHG